MSVSLGELAVRFGCELRGDPDTRIEGVAPLGAGREHALSFLANPRYARALATTRSAAVVLDRAAAASSPVPCLVNDNPYATYARIAAYLFAPPRAAPGIHASAVVDREARIDPTAYVGACAVIQAGAQIGARSFIGPHCFVAAGVIVGEEVRLVAHVSLGERVTLGSRIIIHPGAVLGAPDRGVFVKVPQLGGVRIGDDVEIGANTTIDRGALGDTIIEEGVKLDNLIQIAHNARIGAHTVIAASTGVSGSVTIGRRCMIGGAVGFAGHISICDDVSIAGYSVITHTIKRPGVYSGLIPSEEISTWRRIVARLKRIELLAARVAAVEQKLNMRASGAQSEDDE